MSLLLRALLFVPIVFLTMIVYVSPGQPDAATTVRAALRASYKVFAWAIGIVLVMEAIEFLMLP
jgi:hypothetical protein